MSSYQPRALCLYCGSNVGTSPVYEDVARRLGAALAQRDIELVYGGGRVGLMGVAADAALAEGGRVHGVITEQLVRLEVAHDHLTTLDVVVSMHARKARMAELSDGFLVLPGGFGTLDELAEMLTWNQLGVVAKPIVLVDVGEFWDPLYSWIEAAVDAGFVPASHRMLVQRATTIEEALAMAVAPPPAVGHKWTDQDVAALTGSIAIVPPPTADAPTDGAPTDGAG